MLYMLDTTGEKVFEIVKKEDLWSRIQYKGSKFGIGVLTREGFTIDDFIDLNKADYGEDELVELTTVPVSLSFNRKTLSPYIIKANKFENDLFVAAFDCKDMQLVNQSNRFINLIDYFFDKANGRLIMIFTMRKGFRDEYGYTSLSETFMREQKNAAGEVEKRHWVQYSVKYEPNTKQYFASIESAQTPGTGKPVDKKRVRIRMKNNVHIENGVPQLRRYLPSRPTWSVILTQASKEQEVRDILQSRYNMKDTRLNLVVAKSEESLKQSIGRLRADNITAVTYYLDKFKDGQSVRKNIDTVRESIDNNFFGTNFKKVFVMSANGDATHVRI